MVVAAPAVAVVEAVVEAAAEAATAALAVPDTMIALSAVTLVFKKISSTN